MATSAQNGLSPKAREQLQRELVDLRHQQSASATGLAEHDRGGDAADQADLLEHAETAAWLNRRIAEIEAILEHGFPNAQLLADGSSVTLRYDDGSEDTLRVAAVPGQDADMSVVTADSPLGVALAGREVGEEIKYRTPRGETKATIVAIAPPE
jgi:transcription elongation factor GreA